MIGILAFTDRGIELGRRVGGFLEKAGWDVGFYNKEQETGREYTARHFQEYDGLLFIGAAGICVRMIAPHVRSKDRDPAVIVMDELGQYVIPILSGHIGGANRLAEVIASFTGAVPVITTATDINHRFAADVWAVGCGCTIEDISMIRYISSAVLRGDKAGLDPGNFAVIGKVPEDLVLCGGDGFPLSSGEQSQDRPEKPDTGICISLKGGRGAFARTLNVIPQIVSLGVGCRRDTDPEIFEEAVVRAAERSGISMKSVEAIASIDLKKDEQCMQVFADKYGIPFVTWSAEELMDVPGTFAHSDFVQKTTGADNVCERSAVKQSGGRLILNKTVAEAGVTVAAALRTWECRF